MEDLGITPKPATSAKNESNTNESMFNSTSLASGHMDPFSKFKLLKKHLNFLTVQEDYIKDEMRNLRQEYLHAQEEVKRIKSIPLIIGQFLEAVDHNTAIVSSTTGQNHYVRILSTIDRELLKANASIALHKHSNALVDIRPPERDSSIQMLGDGDRPDVS